MLATCLAPALHLVSGKVMPLLPSSSQEVKARDAIAHPFSLFQACQQWSNSSVNVLT